MTNKRIFSVKLDPLTHAKLEALADQSGRARGQVIQRLINSAADNRTPELIKALGILETEVKTPCQ